jgi:hypothetical protein
MGMKLFCTAQSAPEANDMGKKIAMTASLRLPVLGCDNSSNNNKIFLILVVRV